MKTQNKRLSRSLLSVLLSMCMLTSCATVALFPANAVTTASDELIGGSGSTTGDWHLYNSIRNQWDNGTSAMKLSGGTNDYYTDFYLRPCDGNIYWTYYSKDDKNTLNAWKENANVTAANDNLHHNGFWGDGGTSDKNKSWMFPSSALDSGSGTGTSFYKVRVHLNPAGGECSNNNAGWTWVTWGSALSDYSVTLTTKKGSAAATDFIAGDTVSLSASDANAEGTSTYTYEYKKSTDSTWTTVSGTSFEPANAGTYYVKVTATDGGVVSSGNNKNAITSRTATDEKTITVTPATYNITISAKTGNTVSTTGGTVSPASYQNLAANHQPQSISATPASSYVFAGWSCENGNISFTDAYSASTTFTATGDDTIYGTFTQDTLYSVSVNNGMTTSNVSAGEYFNPEVTAVYNDDEYRFVRWDHTGDVAPATGYSWTSQTIKIKATGTGTMTAVFEHDDYIYFYAALQSSWSSNPVVTVDGTEISAYAWIAQKDNSELPAKTLYQSGSNGAAIGIGTTTYYIGIYRVKTEKSGKNISVFNSIQTGTDTNKGYCGTVQSGSGVCYYTYSDGSTSNNTSGYLAGISITSVTHGREATPGYSFDVDDTISIGKQETLYKGPSTAGQDGFTYTYQLINNADGTVAAVLDDDLPSSTSNYSFKPEDYSITAGNYKVRIIAKDSTTGKMKTFCDSAVFPIAVPSHSIVSFSGTNATVTGSYTYRGESQSLTTGTSLKSGSAVTLTYTLQEGYEQGTTTKTGISSVNETYNASTRTLTITFTVPTGGADITVSHSASEILHTVHVKKRFYQSDGVNLIGEDSVDTQTITGVGITTSKQVDAAPTVTDYSFWSFVLPASGVDGTPSGSNAFNINATDDATIYIDYKETMHTLTLVNDGRHGTIKQDGSANTGPTIQVGNVTGVTLVATPSNGYQFINWTASPAAAVTIGNASSYQSLFKTNADATLTANYSPVDYTLSVTVNPAQGGTAVILGSDGQPKSGGHIGDTFRISVTIDSSSGYAFDSINGVPAGGTEITNNETTYVAEYTLGAGNVNATVNLKAAVPSISNVKIRDIVHLTDNLDDWAVYNANSTVEHYYGQPVEAAANTESFARLNYSVQHSGTTTDSESKITGGTSVTLETIPNVIPDSENGTVTYTFTITAENAPTGVSPVYSAPQAFTIQVKFNSKQKAFFKLSGIWSDLVSDPSSSYFSDASAQIGNYNTAYNAASTFYGNGSTYPAYNDTDSTDVYDNLKEALKSLMKKAKETNVTVLTSIPKNSQATPAVNVSFSMNSTNSDTTAGWDYFKMYSLNEKLNSSESNRISDAVNNAFHTNYEGYVENKNNRSTKYYIYKFSYAGIASFQVWGGNAADDASFNNNKKLTGVIANVTGVGSEHYVDASSATVGNGSVTTSSPWNDFGHVARNNTRKIFLELDNTEYTASDVKTLFDIQETGSIIDSPGNIYTENTAFTITGPMGKASSKTVNLKQQNFEASVQGKYKVSYTTQFGTNESGTEPKPYEKTGVFFLWVAFDDVTIYVDMNDNVGTPILNFKYKVDSQGKPTELTAGATDAYLPYEMDLVTGSESVYKYTIKTSKLKSDYYLKCDSENQLTISYITVENNKIGQGTGGFVITNDARISGEIWFKANSTHLTTFNTLATGSNLIGFVAVTDDSSHKVLNAALGGVHGTGIVTDDDEIYHSRYAAAGTDSTGLTNYQQNFHYVMNAVTNPETKLSGSTYYFDRWIRIKTPADGLTVYYDKENTENVRNQNLVHNNSDKTDVDLSEAEEYSPSADLSFTAALPYNGGDGDYTYIALYKQVQQSDPTVRVEVTYRFKDYDTSDGNFIMHYTPSDLTGLTAAECTVKYNEKTVDASYTKVIKVTDKTFEQVRTDIQNVVKSSAPYIKSNYFDYTYTDGSATIDEEGTVALEKKIKVTATFAQEPHLYTIVVKNGENVNETKTGFYQNIVELSAPEGMENPVWKRKPADSSEADIILAAGETYNARFMSDEFGVSSGDTQCIKVMAGTANAAAHLSVVTSSTTVIENENAHEVLHHNFYIVDYCEKGRLVGGGVLFATGTYSGGEWGYRQQNAETHLATKASRESFISNNLNNDYSTEYKAQTIENVGFRYIPFRSSDDVFRYSDTLSAYLTVYDGTNVNSQNYDGQKMRLFSFMVYDPNGNGNLNDYIVVCSEGYGEVDRYLAH